MSKSWASHWLNVIAPPGGLPLCAYSFCCGPCAAGDAAHAAGNNWVASCLCTVCGFGCSPFVRCADRQAAKAKHGVDDGCSPGLTCLGSCCCGCCFVTQQLNQELSTGKALKDVILHIPTQEEMAAAPAAAIKALTDAFNSAPAELQKAKAAALEKK